MGKILATVGLEGVRFKSAIGLYPEERIFKNEFTLDISVSYVVQQAVDEDLENTIDYSKLYDIAVHFFSQEYLLIETVGHHILEGVIAKFPQTECIDLCIKKSHPPIKAEIAASFIKLNYKK